jgi:hypothetical protein
MHDARLMAMQAPNMHALLVRGCMHVCMRFEATLCMHALDIRAPVMRKARSVRLHRTYVCDGKSLIVRANDVERMKGLAIVVFGQMPGNPTPLCSCISDRRSKEHNEGSLMDHA